MINFPGFNKNLHLVRQEPDPDKRDKNYYLQNCQAFYSEYLKGGTTVGYSRNMYISYLRAFAEGRQPDFDNTPTPKKVKQSAILDIHGNPIETKSEDYPNIRHDHEVWDILSPANKIMTTLEGTLSKIEYEVNADPLDYATIHEVEQAKYKRWAYAKNREKIQFAANLAEVSFPEPDFIPESPEDLDQYTEEFLPAHVRYVEQIIKHSFDISHWDPDIKKLFYRDLFSLGLACIKNEYDPEDGKVKPVYIDPAEADIQKSKWMDCRDSERGWHFTLMSISTLRQYFPNKPEEWFKNAAYNYSGKFDNPPIDFFGRYTEENGRGGWGYDPFKVCIGNFEWIDINKSAEEISTNKYGRKIIKEIPISKAIVSDKVIRFSEDRMRYQAKWVVGTDELFEYGPAYDVTYPTKNDTELTYKWIVLPGKSIIEQLIPIFKNFQDLWDKYRELLQNAQGKYQFIDIDMLTTTAGENDTPEEAAKKSFRRFLATGKMLFRRINAAGMPNQNAPIAEADGGMGTLFEQIMAGFKTNIDLVEYITGINPLSMGGSADPNLPVTTAQMSMNATSNTLRPLVEAYMREKQAISENLVRWVSVLVRGNQYSREAYEEVIGKAGIQSLLVALKDDASYGITLNPRPNELEKQWILQNLQAAVTPAQGGEREISTADANLLLNMISSGATMKTIQYFFEKARKKQKATLMAEKKELMEVQSKKNQQDALVSAEAKMKADQQAHTQNMELQELKNKGLVGNTLAQETMRKDKDVSVQQVKNEGQKDKVSEPALP